MTSAPVLETTVPLRGPACPLRLVLTAPPSGTAESGVLICSPSPLLGGDLENNVTEALAREAAARGLAAVRFDYRNAGRSGDSTDGLPRSEWWHLREERGDLSAAVADARAVLRHVRRLFRPVAVLGYSFGAWVAFETGRAAGLPAVGICPPLSRLDFRGLAGPHDAPSLLVVAEGDELDAPPPLHVLARRFPASRLVLLEAASHFLIGREGPAVRHALDFAERFAPAAEVLR